MAREHTVRSTAFEEAIGLLRIHGAVVNSVRSEQNHACHTLSRILQNELDIADCPAAHSFRSKGPALARDVFGMGDGGVDRQLRGCENPYARRPRMRSTSRPARFSQRRRLAIVLALNVALIGGLTIVGITARSVGVLAAAGDHWLTRLPWPSD